MARFNLKEKMKRKIQPVLRKESEKQLRRGLTAIAKAGKPMMENRRRQVIKDWFGEYDAVDLMASTECDVNKNEIGYDRGEVIFNTYSDLSILDRSYPKAEAWRDRRRKEGGDYGDDSAKYVTDLQYYQGIIGLPEKGTRSLNFPEGTKIGGGHINNNHWINDNFVQREPLINVLQRELNDKTFLQSIIIKAGLKY